MVGVANPINVVPKEWSTVQDHAYLERISTELFTIAMEAGDSSSPVHFPSSMPQVMDSFKLHAAMDKVDHNPLGPGQVTAVEWHRPLTKGKVIKVIDVRFDIGQTCRFSMLLDEAEIDVSVILPPNKP